MAPSAELVRVRELFKSDGVTVYRLDMRALYGDSDDPNEPYLSDWKVLKIGTAWVNLTPVNLELHDNHRMNLAMLLKAYDLAQESTDREESNDEQLSHCLHIFTDQPGLFAVDGVQGNKLLASPMRSVAIDLSELMKELERRKSAASMLTIKASFDSALSVVSDSTPSVASVFVARTRTLDFIGTIEPLARKSQTSQGLVRPCNHAPALLSLLKTNRDIVLIVRLQKSSKAPPLPTAPPMVSLEPIHVELPEMQQHPGGYGGRDCPPSDPPPDTKGSKSGKTPAGRKSKSSREWSRTGGIGGNKRRRGEESDTEEDEEDLMSYDTVRMLCFLRTIY